MEYKEIPTIEQCLEIGTISRPQGKDGEVLVSLKNIEQEDFKNFRFVFLCRQERLVPFFMEKVTIKSNSVFVKFEDFTSMEKAESYCGTKIYIENCDDSEDSQGSDLELEGYTIVDASTNKEIGVVQEMIAYSINIVLDIRKIDNTSVLIPFADDLLKQFDEEHKKIVLEIPDGILDA